VPRWRRTVLPNFLSPRCPLVPPPIPAFVVSRLDVSESTWGTTRRFRILFCGRRVFPGALPILSPPFAACLSKGVICHRGSFGFFFFFGVGGVWVWVVCGFGFRASQQGRLRGRGPPTFSQSSSTLLARRDTHGVLLMKIFHIFLCRCLMIQEFPSIPPSHSPSTNSSSMI